MEKSITVILAEDEPIMSEMYATKMRKSGMEVFQAKNGTEAIALAKEHHPQMILLDILMPMVDGFDVLAALRPLPEFATTPIYMFTNLTQEEDRRKAKQLGATGFLIKANTTPTECVEFVKLIVNRTQQ